MKRDTSLNWQATALADLDLKHLRVALIGGTGGIGRAFSHSLAARGARVLVVGRTFRDHDIPGIEFLSADLTLLREAADLAGRLQAETLDLVVFTTGIIAGPQREETDEGIERDLAVSYLNRLVILRAIADRLGSARPDPRSRPRVFVMGNPGQGAGGTPDDLNSERSYKSMPVHMNTVAANEALVLDAAHRFPHLDVFGLAPGLVRTGIRSNLMGPNSLRYKLLEAALTPFAAATETYARRITPLLVSPDIEGRSGAMFNRKGAAILPSPALDGDRVAAFTAASEDLLARTGVALA
jgi:NAD(P)-dependent dehydrogenase (short-subunit alcohol dehydrogenase family)